MNAVENVFESARIVGFLFHLGQNLWRKVHELQLVECYRTDESFRMHVKMILALSFVPVSDVEAAFVELEASSP